MLSRNLPQLSHIAAGLTAVVVGYSSAVVIVIEAARAAGASADMIISWLLVLGLGMGFTCILFSWFYKVPVVTAWSTPGAAFLIGAVNGFTLQEVIGAFVLAAVFAFAAARIKALTKQIERIPPAVSSAMLAGILLPICLNVFADAATYPAIVVGFIAVYLLGSLLFPRYLMLVLLIVAIVVSINMPGVTMPDVDVSLPVFVWVQPAFSLSATISLALPLFIITLLSQNLPGIAILKSFDYQPDTRQVLTGISIVNVIAAPFGGFAFNLAAITAAICMGEEAGADRDKRYLASVMAGVGYLIMGVLASAVVVVFSMMPTVIVHLLAGLALLGTLQASLLRSLEVAQHRKAAMLTLVCCASGITVAQLGAPVWGLLLGLTVLAVDKAYHQMGNKKGA